MNPPMHTRVRNYFADAGLMDGFTPQLLFWDDSGDQGEAYMVFRPNGGTAIRDQLGSDYYILVDVISAKIKKAVADERVQTIISYIQQNPMSDNCIGYLQNLGGIPAPVLTAEGRLVYRLQFVATHGDQ